MTTASRPIFSFCRRSERLYALISTGDEARSETSHEAKTLRIMPASERDSWFQYREGIDPSFLNVGTLVLDYANPKDHRPYRHELWYA